MEIINATTNNRTDIDRRRLIALSPEQRLELYKAVCSSLSLNPLTKPFAYIQLNGKLTLYALKDCTDQLRTIHGISISILSREVIEGVYVVTAHAQRPDGRHDESTGAVPIDGIKGETRANALMKAETKAKRRATLSICGLGMLDESEVDSIKGARRVDYPETIAAAERRFDADMAKQHKLSMSEKKQIAQAEAIVARLPRFLCLRQCRGVMRLWLLNHRVSFTLLHRQPPLLLNCWNSRELPCRKSWQI